MIEPLEEESEGKETLIKCKHKFRISVFGGNRKLSSNRSDPHSLFITEHLTLVLLVDCSVCFRLKARSLETPRHLRRHR